LPPSFNHAVHSQQNAGPRLAALARQPHNIFLQKMDPLAEVFSG
jgi:hypothetical protein